MSFINPTCNMPLFQQVDSNIVANCARLNGYIISSIISIILIITIIILLTKMKKKENEKNKKYSNRRKYVLIGIGICILIVVLAWLFIPMLSSWIDRRRWQGYQYQIEALMKNGYTRQKAMSKIQSLYQTNEQANALRDGASDIANSIRSYKYK